MTGRAFMAGFAWLAFMPAFSFRALAEAPLGIDCPLSPRRLSVDGDASEAVWRRGAEIRCSSGNPTVYRLEAARDADGLGVLVVFERENEVRTHRPWVWDAVSQSYRPGDVREETVCLIFHDGRSDRRDIWIWRSARTDPAGSAGDYHAVFSAVDSAWVVIPDSGALSWFSRYQGAFIGGETPRFHSQKPNGGMADVRARGIWREGIWTLEFHRDFRTSDDGDSDLAGKVGFNIFFHPPTAADIAAAPDFVLSLPMTEAEGVK